MSCTIIIGLNKQHLRDNLYQLLEVIIDIINFEFKIFNTDEILEQLRNKLDHICEDIFTELKKHSENIEYYNSTNEIDEIFLIKCNNNNTHYSIITNVLYRYVMEQNIMYMADFNSKMTRENFEFFVFNVILDVMHEYDEKYTKFIVIH